MKRKDFELVAAAMRKAKPDTHDAYCQWFSDVETLADAFEEQSIAFDRELFFRNCELAF